MQKHKLTLFSYYRSTAAYRVRIALNLKGLVYEYKSVHGLRTGDKAFLDYYHKLNPQNLIPTLMIDETAALSQSLAIVDWLDENYPKPALLPKGSLQRTYVRSLALHIACDIHPLNIMRVKKYLTDGG